ncbi:MAG: glycerate kinase [Acholeplasmataceae bacterium]
MKIVIAIDAFKGTISSKKLSEIISDKFKTESNVIKTFPISDGGEGFIDAIKHFYNCESKVYETYGPLLNQVNAEYVLIEQTAFLEINSTSGITLINKKELNPLKTSTYGFGLLIKHVIKEGAKKIVFGLGGSATNDGGAGMLQGLGANFFYDKKLIEEPLNGNLIGFIDDIDLSELEKIIKDIEFIVALDVANPLLGADGATHIFSSQKGASLKQRNILEENMTKFADLIESKIGKNFRHEKGAGAAGGVGFTALAILKAKFNMGINFIIDLFNLEEEVKESDLVIVGEGQLDSQTKFGKAPLGIAKMAKKYNKKVIGLFGLTSDVDVSEYIDKVYSVVPKYASKKESLENPIKNFQKMLDNIRINKEG